MSPRAPQTFGYSGTPLVRKLGIKPNSRIAFVAAPRNLRELLGPLPKSAVVAKDGSLDFAILFVKSRAELAKDFAGLRDRLEPAGMLWVAWPKRTSGVPTDLVEGIVREFGLEAGLVDVKVCAIDDTWSGLKFVRRLKDR
ncbi:MAG TPA: DUF3052 domain-containing protein [Gemmatimonadaceae bacterium]|nr:DUF3052 domain-containing protein [Gemmatimonadaceae bacterium]